MDTTIPKYIDKEFVWKHPEIIFIYGDNILRQGYGGQAKVCRGYPNAYGIPTKRTPCTDERACYMQDELADIYCGIIDQAIKNIPRDDGRVIYVIPGIGEGHSRLKEKAPIVYAYLMKRLKEEFNYENNTINK